ncbi:unnamed protein product [Victoria cruziana]
MPVGHCCSAQDVCRHDQWPLRYCAGCPAGRLLMQEMTAVLLSRACAGSATGLRATAQCTCQCHNRPPVPMCRASARHSTTIFMITKRKIIMNMDVTSGMEGSSMHFYCSVMERGSDQED